MVHTLNRTRTLFQVLSTSPGGLPAVLDVRRVVVRRCEDIFARTLFVVKRKIAKFHYARTKCKTRAVTTEAEATANAYPNPYTAYCLLLRVFELCLCVHELIPPR